MSWRDAARKHFPDHAPVPNVPNRPMGEAEAAIGTFGLFGTGGDVGNCTHLEAHVAAWMDWQERAAIMEYDGGLPRREAAPGASQDAIVDSHRRRWPHARHDDTGRSTPMKTKFIAAAFALSTFVLFGCSAVAQGDALQKADVALLHEDYVDAAKWYRLAAEQGDAEAQFALGVLYDFGEGVPENDAEAVKWYRLAAEQGYAKAQYNLGHSYAHGEGVPENDTEAVKWYRLAADQGFADAQHNLGLMYDNGKGVPENDAEAAKWYRLAADQGDAYAQINLGILYGTGQGVPQDYVQAYKWYNLAAAQGEEDANRLKEIVRKWMTREQIAEAQKLSFEWKPVGER